MLICKHAFEKQSTSNLIRLAGLDFNCEHLSVCSLRMSVKSSGTYLSLNFLHKSLDICFKMISLTVFLCLFISLTYSSWWRMVWCKLFLTIFDVIYQTLYINSSSEVIWISVACCGDEYCPLHFSPHEPLGFFFFADKCSTPAIDFFLHCYYSVMFSNELFATCL